nr:EAL domain-containing protein [Desulfosporosinus metallidurans]
MGISVAMDDWETEYAVVKLLKILSLGSVKIERIFVHDIEKCANTKLIVEAMISLPIN